MSFYLPLHIQKTLLMPLHSETFQFLSELAKNNNRDWFQTQKQRCQTARNDVVQFITSLLPEIHTMDGFVIQRDASQCLYRQYRDTRFSHDKTPYKTHIAGFLTYSYKNHDIPGYYLHFSPDLCMLGGGIYLPNRENLYKIRSEIVYHAAEFKKIVEDKTFCRYFGKLDEEHMLKKNPKNFPVTQEVSEYLRHKDFFAGCVFPAKDAQEKGFDSFVVERLRALVPLNHFLFKAIS